VAGEAEQLPALGTAGEVSAGGAATSPAAGESVTSGRASSAGGDWRAASSAARTSGSISSAVTAVRETTPAAVPWPPSTAAMTVRLRVRVTPLVVRPPSAHRRLTEECSSAITTVASARDSSSARSTVSWGEVTVRVIVRTPAGC
jgi:hypothetical protein